ncbi:MAG: amidase [Betaproteobacteria bacterium]|nr:MAG: amidase [Betaproteobacteria bacterium]
MAADEPWRWSAQRAVAALRAGSLDPADLVALAFARMDTRDGELNAVPTRLPARARAACERVRAERAVRLSDPRWLAGLPIVVKDTHPVAGARTTFGSTAFADHVPASSAWHVERLEEMGAIVVGKSNTPEFAAGAQTFNDVHGITRNPWDPRLTCGGSSGGSAVALATGMAWLADGSDLGGSLRIPAAFCGVVGLRPSLGRVPHGPQRVPYQTLNVVGPMARSVGDVALMLDALAGPDARDPLSLPAPVGRFVDALDGPVATSIGCDLALGGLLPLDPAIERVVRAAIVHIEATGIGCPPVDLVTREACASFRALRAAYLAADLGGLDDAQRAAMKPELRDNIAQGLALDGAALARAERERGVFLAHALALLERHAVLALPTTIMPPFDADQRFPAEFRGERFDTYFDWAAPAFVLSLLGCPVLSLPCGLTDAGLPVGLQLVAPPRAEAALLATAARIESILAFRLRTLDER